MYSNKNKENSYIVISSDYASPDLIRLKATSDTAHPWLFLGFLLARIIRSEGSRGR